MAKLGFGAVLILIEVQARVSGRGKKSKGHIKQKRLLATFGRTSGNDGLKSSLEKHSGQELKETSPKASAMDFVTLPTKAVALSSYFLFSHFKSKN